MSVMMAQLNSNPGERAIFCPHCDYMELWDEEIRRHQFWIDCRNCNIQTCVVCKEILSEPMSSAMFVQNSLTPAQEEVLEQHRNCFYMSRVKDDLTQAISLALGRCCPSCGGNAGRLESGCTHMDCRQCYSRYCYSCGLLIREADAHPNYTGAARSSGHNQVCTL